MKNIGMYSAMGASIVLIFLAAGYVYMTTSPLFIEPKELKGTLGALASYAQEVALLDHAHDDHRIGPVFFLAHLDQIDDQIDAYQSSIESKPFDQGIPVSKQEILTLLDSLKNEIKALRDHGGVGDDAELIHIAEEFKDLAGRL
jgi:hypothetical protein